MGLRCDAAPRRLTRPRRARAHDEESINAAGWGLVTKGSYVNDSLFWCTFDWNFGLHRSCGILSVDRRVSIYLVCFVLLRT